MGQARVFYKRHRYAHLKQILPPPILSLLHRYGSEMKRDGKAIFRSDPHHTDRYQFISDRVLNLLCVSLTDAAEFVVGTRLRPTYDGVLAIYTDLDDGRQISFAPHQDQQSFVLSVNVSGEGWPLMFSRNPAYYRTNFIHPFDMKHPEPEKPAECDQISPYAKIGDGVLFSGSRFTHWREPKPAGLVQVQLLLGFDSDDDDMSYESPAKWARYQRATELLFSP